MSRSVSFEDIEILGHWCGAHIVKSYLTGMPLQACLMRAGHLEDAFVLPRGRLEVPEGLAGKLFPGIDDALQYFSVSLTLSMLQQGFFPCPALLPTFVLQ